MVINKSRITGLSWYVLFIFITLLFPAISFGFGLEVDPGEIDINNVALGREVAVSALGGERMKLKIENKGGAEYTYIIDILSARLAGAPLKEGYQDIPDTSWIFPENKEVTVAGRKTKEVELYLKLPKNKEYYSKKYQAIIEVKTKKKKPEDLFELACQLRICFSTFRSKEEEEKGMYPRNITVIKTKDKWSENPEALSRLKAFFPYSEIELIDYSTKTGEGLVKQLSIDFLPAYILSRDVEKNTQGFAREESNLIQSGNYYLWSFTWSQNGIFLDRQRRPHTLEIFYKSYDSTSRQLVDKIIAAKKDGRIPKRFKLDWHYPANLAESCAERGEQGEALDYERLRKEPEIAEDVIQLCIKKYSQNKFLDYLLLRNKNIESVNWDVPAKDAGVEIKAVRKCISQEGEALLKEDIKRAQELNITTVPILLYENRVVILDPSLLKELPGLEKLEIEGLQ